MAEVDLHYEVESKYRLEDAAQLAATVGALGASFSPPEPQSDLYLAHPSRDFAQTDEALRIRSVGDRNWVTYKGPRVDQTTKTRRELEVPIIEAEGLGQLLQLLGFRPVATVRKLRRVARVRHEELPFEICLDEVDDVGSFVELETSAAAAQLDQARQALQSLARQLGLQHSERRSYLELLLA